MFAERHEQKYFNMYREAELFCRCDTLAILYTESQSTSLKTETRNLGSLHTVPCSLCIELGLKYCVRHFSDEKWPTLYSR